MVALALRSDRTPGAVIGFVKRASETYPYSSLYAFNGWSIGLDFWKDDAAWVVPGGILLAIGLLASVVPLRGRPDTAALPAVASAAGLALHIPASPRARHQPVPASHLHRR